MRTKESHNKAMRKYYQEHKEQIKAKVATYRDTHKEEIKNYKQTHKDDAKLWRETHPNYIRNYFRELKQWAVDKLGRRCANCGLISKFDCVYDFHHEGENSWSNNKNPSNIRIKELIKWKKEDSIPNDVKLLCSNCHRIEHHS